MSLILKLVPVLAFLMSCIQAQGLSGLPTCATQATFSNIASSGCQITDIQCICKDQSFISSLFPVVEKACSADDVQKTIEFTQNLCKTAGITLTIAIPAVASTTSSPPDSTGTANNASTVTSNGNATTTGTGTASTSTGGFANSAFCGGPGHATLAAAFGLIAAVSYF